MKSLDFHQHIEPLLLKRAEGTQIAWVQVDETVTFNGLIKNEDQVQPAPLANSVMEIGSISKVFTAVLAAQLLEQGHLSVSDRLSCFIPNRLKHDATLAELLSHTSGLSRSPPGMLWTLLGKERHNPYAKISRSRLTGLVGKQLKQKNVGRYQYSNFGYGLLTLVLEKVTGLTFEQQLQQKICQPLAMNNTTTVRNILPSAPIQGFDSAGNAAAFWDMNALVAAGGVLSCCEDMAKFAQYILSQPSWLSLITKPIVPVASGLQVGLGWHLLEHEQHEPVLWHNGGTGGAQSQLFIDVASKKAVSVLANHSVAPFKFSQAIERYWRDQLLETDK